MRKNVIKNGRMNGGRERRQWALCPFFCRSSFTLNRCSFKLQTNNKHLREKKQSIPPAWISMGFLFLFSYCFLDVTDTTFFVQIFFSLVHSISSNRTEIYFYFYIDTKKNFATKNIMQSNQSSVGCILFGMAYFTFEELLILCCCWLMLSSSSQASMWASRSTVNSE